MPLDVSMDVFMLVLQCQIYFSCFHPLKCKIQFSRAMFQGWRRWVFDTQMVDFQWRVPLIENYGGWRGGDAWTGLFLRHCNCLHSLPNSRTRVKQEAARRALVDHFVGWEVKALLSHNPLLQNGPWARECLCLYCLMEQGLRMSKLSLVTQSIYINTFGRAHTCTASFTDMQLCTRTRCRYSHMKTHSQTDTQDWNGGSAVLQVTATNESSLKWVEKSLPSSLSKRIVQMVGFSPSPLSAFSLNVFFFKERIEVP